VRRLLILFVDDAVLKHADVGDFTIDPKIGLISKMKGEGHGQSNLGFLVENNIDYNIVETYSDGVRGGNVPGHKTVAKHSGIGQSWFPDSWTSNEVKEAGEYVANLAENLDAVDGQMISGIYNNIKVCVIKTNGKIGTIFTDSIQP